MRDPEPLGDRAIRFARPVGVAALAIVREVRGWPGVVDVVVAQRDVAAYYDGAPVVPPGALEALARLTGEPPRGRDHVLRATYDGPDLDAVAHATGLAPAGVIALHAAGVYTVELIGFAPGFAYLGGVDPRLHLARRASPRPRVPAGSLAIAAGYTAVYPFDSAGGWHLIGRVATPMFGPAGSLLQLGDRVRFDH